MKIKANGISINYQVDGPDGAPWLVLSNSLATNLTMWDDQARELGRAFRVLRYDQRGHGLTEARPASQRQRAASNGRSASSSRKRRAWRPWSSPPSRAGFRPT